MQDNTGNCLEKLDVLLKKMKNIEKKTTFRNKCEINQQFCMKNIKINLTNTHSNKRKLSPEKNKKENRNNIIQKHLSNEGT